MTLADQIIEHGPFGAYQVVPNAVMRWIESDQLNALRDELIELRRLRAAEQRRSRYEVRGVASAEDAQLWLVPGGGDPIVVSDGPLTLAELVRRADEHTEGCR